MTDAARRIVYIQYTNPAGYPSLEHSARLLADAGWRVLFLGTVAPHDVMRFRPHAHITTRYLAFQARGWKQKIHFLTFCAWAMYETWRWRAQWLYASDLYATPTALLMNYVLPVKVIYHEHDTPAGTSFLARICRATRARLARRATLCVLPNQKRAQMFAQQFDVVAKTFCVWNCPERAEVVPLPARVDSRFRLLYHGSIVPSRLPLAVIDALTQLPEYVCLRIVGYETIGHTGYVETLLRRARELHLEARVEYVQHIPRFELLERARECDVGLALLPLQSADVNEQTMTGASNKPFDYLACGLPLIVSDLADWRALFVENGFARACNPADASSIAQAVCWYLDHPRERRAMGERGRAKILSEWNYETQFVNVYKSLRE